MNTPASRPPRSGLAPLVLAAELRHLAKMVRHNSSYQVHIDAADALEQFAEDVEERSSAVKCTPSAPPAVNDGWQDMTAEAMRIQQRHLDNHDGDVYHAMQALMARFGKPWDGVLVQSLPPREPPAAESAEEIDNRIRKRHATPRAEPQAAVRGWLPIETAPKDGTPVIVGLISEQGRIALRVSDARYTKPMGWYDTNGAHACNWATHWIPSPPVREGGAG